MSALTVTTRTSSHGSEPEYCACGEPHQTPYERRNDRRYECEPTDQRMACAVCKEYLGIAYCDGRPTFSSPPRLRMACCTGRSRWLNARGQALR